MGETRNVYIISVVKPEGENPLESPGSRRKNNIKTVL